MGWANGVNKKQGDACARSLPRLILTFIQHASQKVARLGASLTWNTSIVSMWQYKSGIFTNFFNRKMSVNEQKVGAIKTHGAAEELKKITTCVQWPLTE